MCSIVFSQMFKGNIYLDFWSTFSLKLSFVCHPAPQIPDNSTASSAHQERSILGLLCHELLTESAFRWKARAFLWCASLFSGITLLPVVQCLRTVASYILPSFIVVYVGRVSVIKLLSWLEAEVLLYDFKVQFIFLVL